MFGIGTLKRVADTMYLRVRRRERRRVAAGRVRDLEDLVGLEARQVDARDARRVVALMNSQRPSGTPSVCDSSGWWESSHGTKPYVVCSIGLVSSL